MKNVGMGAIGALLCLVMCGASFGSVVSAQESTPETVVEPVGDNQFIARPDGGTDGGFFNAEVEPGATVTFTMYVENAGSVPVEIEAYVSNAGSAPNGGLVIAPPEAELQEPTTWVTFPDYQQVLQAGESQAVEFSVSVPEGTAPGQYINAIAVQTVDAFEIEGNASFRQRVRKVLPVYVQVPGELVAEYSVGSPTVEFRTQGPVIVIPFVNSGNVRVSPAGQLVVNDATGVELLVAPFFMGPVFGGHTTSIEVRLPSALPAGDYLLSLQLEDELTGAKAEFVDTTLAMPEPPTLAASNVQIVATTVTPNADPIQFANIKVELSNQGAVVQSARLTVSAYRDGEFVEDFILADSLTIPEGPLAVEQRYIPLTGFEPGTWSFVVTLDSVDAATGLVTELVTVPDAAILEVP